MNNAAQPYSWGLSQPQLLTTFRALG